MAIGVERPLKELAETFQDLALTVGPSSPPMTLEAFLRACSKMSPMIAATYDDSSYLFEEFDAKIELIRNNVSNDATTLAELIDQDKANNRIRVADSNCRLLVRLIRTLEFIKVVCQELLIGRDVSLQTAAENAYKSVFARYHDTLTQTIVVGSISEVPTRAEIQEKINETADDLITYIKGYVEGSIVVIEYVDKLFTSKEVGTDW
ncbi:unnamed protein product [Alopecurus aequalis]